MTGMREIDEQFFPENDLEEQLLAAQRGDLAVDEFLSSLFQSDLFVPSATPVGEGLASVTPMLYERSGGRLLVIFTALNRAKVMQSEAPYCLKAGGRDILLRMPPEHGIVVNPSYRAGLEISPSTVLEIKAKAKRAE